MSSTDYPAVFHLRICRAKRDLETLSALLDQMDQACQRDANGDYLDLNAVDTESLEKLEILSDSVSDECGEAKRAMGWYRREQQREAT